MKNKLLFILSMCLLIAMPGYCADDWVKALPLAADNWVDYPTDQQANNTAVDRLLSNYREGMKLAYSSATTISVSAGEVVCSNSAGTLRKFRKNTSATNVTFADIDAGAEAGSTTYYLYAVADADAETATFKISLSSSTPTGATYYKRLGSFYNDSSSNITQIVNDNSESFRSAVSKSVGTTYQALTDGIVTAGIYGGSASGGICYLKGYTDNAAAPTTLVGLQSWGVTGDKQDWGGAYSFPVKKGDYYKTAVEQETGTASGYSTLMYFIPLQ